MTAIEALDRIIKDIDCLRLHNDDRMYCFGITDVREKVCLLKEELLAK